MSLTTTIEIPPALGGGHAFTDMTRFSDGSTWDDLAGQVEASSQGSAFFGVEGFMERRPSFEKSAARIMGLK